MKQIKQWDAKDCGVSCVSYLIQYYGGYVPMEKLREDTFTSRNGTNAYFLIQALKKYGFDAVGKKISLEELDKSVFPLIGHFVLNLSYLYPIPFQSINMAKNSFNFIYQNSVLMYFIKKSAKKQLIFHISIFFSYNL